MATRGYIQFPKPFPVPLTLQGANLAGQQLAGGLGTRKGARLGAFQELLLEPVSERQGKPVEKITWSFPESWGYPSWMVFVWETGMKWMMTGGTDSGNLHMGKS